MRYRAAEDIVNLVVEKTFDQLVLVEPASDGTLIKLLYYISSVLKVHSTRWDEKGINSQSSKEQTQKALSANNADSSASPLPGDMNMDVHTTHLQFCLGLVYSVLISVGKTESIRVNLCQYVTSSFLFNLCSTF